jgi:hypothetical protein
MTDEQHAPQQPQQPAAETSPPPDQEILSLGRIMNDAALPLEQRQAAQAKQLALFRVLQGTQPHAAPSLGISPQQAQLEHERGQIAGLAAIINDFTKPAMARQAALEKQYELLSRQRVYQWSDQRIDPVAPPSQTQGRPQAEDPGQKQVAQEAQWLAECYDRAMRGRLPSGQQHRDNAVWIKVLPSGRSSAKRRAGNSWSP